jgi:hypothetical protein
VHATSVGIKVFASVHNEACYDCAVNKKKFMKRLRIVVVLNPREFLSFVEMTVYGLWQVLFETLCQQTF